MNEKNYFLQVSRAHDNNQQTNEQTQKRKTRYKKISTQ